VGRQHHRPAHAGTASRSIAHHSVINKKKPHLAANGAIFHPTSQTSTDSGGSGTGYTFSIAYGLPPGLGITPAE